MGNYRQEYWNGLPFPSPGEFPDPGMEPGSPALQADALASEPQGKQEYRSGWLFPSPGDLPHLQIKQCPLQCRHILYYLSHQGSPYITLSAMEIVEIVNLMTLARGIFILLNVYCVVDTLWGFPGGSEVKVSACNVGDLALIPGSGRSPGEGNGNPLQYSCLENPMDGRAW